MRTSYLAVTASIVALSAASLASAQGAQSGFNQTEDILEDIEEEASDVVTLEERDALGPLGVPQGWAGSLAITGSFADGNTDTADMSVATRLTYGSGPWTQSFGLALEYGETDGVADEEQYYAIYEFSRAFSPSYYAYGLARAQYDGQADDQIDGFVGAGLGYVVPLGGNSDWRIQAGPGARFIAYDTDDFEETEAAFLVSSRYTYSVSDTVTVTNDTDVLGSDTNVLVNNELGVNYLMNDTLSTRLSYRTEYNSDPGPGVEDTDNTLGVAVVLSY